MTATMDIWERLKPERMDQARDLAVDTEVTTSISPSCTMLYTRVADKTTSNDFSAAKSEGGASELLSE
jgi:chloramphenicol 3-O-phosphotransferase